MMTHILKKIILPKIIVAQKSLSTSMKNPADWKNAKSIYDFSAKNIDGKMESMGKYK